MGTSGHRTQGRLNKGHRCSIQVSTGRLRKTPKGRDWREMQPRWWNNTPIARSWQGLGRINSAKTSEPWTGKVIFAFMLRLIRFTLSLHVFNTVYILFALRPISAYKARCLMDTVLIQLDWRGHMCHMKTVTWQTVFWHCSKKVLLHWNVMN